MGITETVNEFDLNRIDFTAKNQYTMPVVEIKSELNKTGKVKKHMAKPEDVMTLAEAARVFNINKSAIYKAAGDYNEFPNALTSSGLLDTSHPDFINWRDNKYRPHGRPAPMKQCEYVSPEGARCTNTLPRRDHRFCSEEHYVLWRKESGGFSKMGSSGSHGKGRRGAADRSAEATAKRSKAAANSYGGRKKKPTVKRKLKAEPETKNQE